MKNAKVITSIIALFTLFFIYKPISYKKDTTKKTDIKQETKTIEKKETKKLPYIETNSHKESFIWDLINTLPVKEKDTVLFRKWETSKVDSILLSYKNIKYKIKNSKYEYFYKTGNIKFSTYKISIENINTHTYNNIYGYVNHGIYKNPYSMNNISSYLGLKKESNALGRLKISNPHSLGNYIYFTANDNGINITKLEYIANTRGRRKNYSHILDTLIPINSKNKFIDIKKLNKILRVDKNIKE